MPRYVTILEEKEHHNMALISSSKKSSAKDQIYEILRDRIISGTLAEGDKIIDTDVAAEFMVSRTPVREALQRLEMQGLVKSYPGNATLVTNIDRTVIEKPYILMTALQQIAAGEAAKNAVDTDIDELKSLADTFSALAGGKSDPLELLKADMTFHGKIIDISRNEYNRSFCDTLWIHIARLEYGFFRDSASLRKSADEHRRIIDAISLGDSYSASLFMRDHWNRTVMELKTMG